jgi:hypothetical protein
VGRSGNSYVKQNNPDSEKQSIICFPLYVKSKQLKRKMLEKSKGTGGRKGWTRGAKEGVNDQSILHACTNMPKWNVICTNKNQNKQINLGDKNNINIPGRGKNI